MNDYYLANHVFAREVSGYSIFLDLARDRYMALPPEQTKHLRLFCAHTQNQQGAENEPVELESDAIQLARDLEAEGLIVRSRSDGRDFEEPSPLPPLDSLRIRVDSASRISVRQRWHFELARVRAYSMLKLLPLAAVVERVRTRKARAQQRGSMGARDDYGILTGVFSTLYPRDFSKDDMCLRYSLTLVEFLAHFRIYPDWIFGVKIQPFAAHSWVQYRSTVLNDSVHNVETFAPLLVV